MSTIFKLKCGACHGYPLVFLGKLGNKKWYRCPFCGLDQAR